MLRSFAASQSLYERAQRTVAGGVSSTFRRHQRPVPLFFEEGRGSRVIDADGNHFIDYTLAYGPQILGHGHPVIVRAVQEQVARGQTFGAQSRLEATVAERLLALLGWADRVAYVTTGTEAVQLAFRIARAHTGRARIARFEGHYHGWVDNVLLGAGRDEAGRPRPASAGQQGSALADTDLLPWNDLATVEAHLRARGADTAALICEPFLANGGGIEAEPGLLAGLRRLCDAHGVVLIFDEVITGFRVALGGAAERFGVAPDLATYGKAVAGGFPLAAVAGRGPLMEHVREGRVFHAGTFNGNPVVLAAALATLEVLASDGGRALADVEARGRRLMAGLGATFRTADVPVRIQGLGSIFWAFLTSGPMDRQAALASYDGKPYARLTERLLHEGVLVMPSGRWYVSAAHDDADIDATIAALGRALGAPQATVVSAPAA
jgi:glutamate-1-semialdehyde 2,1-aminomutase